jgi:uncharacterized protein YggE
MHRYLLLPTLLFLITSPAAAQQQDGQVTGVGSTEIKRPAEVLRVQVELVVKGKDLKEALTKLKERKEAAKAQLAGLGMAQDAVVFGETAIAAGQTDQQRQMEMMVMQRRGGKKPDAKNKQPDPVYVGCSLKADLPIKAGSGEEQLLACHALQEKIKAADLGATKETEKLSPKDEELAEEMQEMARMMHQQHGEAARGEPTFLYVSKIPAAERDKALREAFRKASDHATRLAKAAGAELGALRSLSSHTQMDTAEMHEMNPYAVRAAARYMRGMSGESSDEIEEAVGISPTSVSVKIGVNASFSIKDKK